MITQEQAETFASLRLIMYHKYPTSARTQFLMQDDGICLPGRLPKLAQLLNSDVSRQRETEKVVAHPSPLLRHVTEWLALPQDNLELDDEFCERSMCPADPSRSISHALTVSIHPSMRLNASAVASSP
jgi:hypothetical protein